MDEPIWSERSNFKFGNSAEDDELQSESDDPNRPGILEWSIDHYVITLPFVSFGYVNGPYQEKLDNLRNLLEHRPHDKTDVIMSLGKTPGSTNTNRDSIGCPVEVMAILIHQIELMCRNKASHTCWEASWHYTAKYLLATPQQNGPETKPCTAFYPFGTINSARCPEYDERIISESAVTRPDYSHANRPNDDLFPYTSLFNSLEKWEKLLLKADRERRRVEVHWDGDSDEFQQMDSAIQNIWHAKTTIWNDQAIFSNSAKPESTEARTIRIGSTMNAFQLCVADYPLEDCVDGAVTVIVEDFCRTLEVHNSSDFDDIRDNFLFFRSLNDRSADIQFHLPVLLVTHQKEAGELRPATCNKQRVDCVSAVRFLAALGIKDFSVYGLSTYGSRGLLSQTWYSEADDCCYILDQIPDAFRFNISNEEGVGRYGAILTAMKAHGEELRSSFESVRESIVERLSPGQGRESLQWTLRAQIKQYPLFYLRSM